MQKIIRILYLALLALTILIGLYYYVDDVFFNELVQEDGLVENISALVLLVMALLLMWRFGRQYRTRNRAWIFTNIILILGLIFGFGEEISWGQRIFSVESSEFFAENNLQKETNIHNLEVGGVSLNKVIFTYAFTIVFAVYFLFSQLLYRKVKYITRLVDNFGIPIPRTIHTIVLVLVTIQIMLINDNRKWELWECLFTVILLMVFANPLNSAEALTGQPEASEA